MVPLGAREARRVGGEASEWDSRAAHSILRSTGPGVRDTQTQLGAAAGSLGDPSGPPGPHHYSQRHNRSSQRSLSALTG